MKWMQDIDMVLSLVLAFWGLVALIGGPIAFFRARKYFPERREAITPEQLRAELGVFDKNLREAFNAEFGRLRLSTDDHHREVLEGLKDAKSRADLAHELATEAKGQTRLIEERVNGLDRLLLDKMKHIEESLTQLRRTRRGDPIE